MHPLRIAPYVLAVLAAQAALDAMPAVVAIREGGMGIGSALIVGQAAQVAALALGAVVAAYLVDRRWGRAVPVVGAVLLGGGLVWVGLQETGQHVDLSWVLATHALAGSGFGIILTAGFAEAAAVAAGPRPLAIALLLLAPVAARSVIGSVFLGGATALNVATGIVLAASVVAMVLRSTREVSASGQWSAGLSGRATVVGGALLAVGVLTALVGADPSGVSAAVVAAPIGLVELGVLDSVRVGVFVVGLVLAFGGAVLLWRRLGPPTNGAVPAVLLVALAASGITAALTFATRAGAIVPGERVLSSVGVAVLVGSALGILLGGTWMFRGGRLRTVAVVGCLVLASGTVLAVAALAVQLPQATGVVPLAVLLAVIGLGGGLAASALRVVLADVAWSQRGLAAAAGVAAAAFGSALGTAIGNGEGIAMISGDSAAVPIGLIVLAAAAGTALVFARMVWPKGADVSRKASSGVRPA